VAAGGDQSGPIWLTLVCRCIHGRSERRPSKFLVIMASPNFSSTLKSAPECRPQTDGSWENKSKHCKHETSSHFKACHQVGPVKLKKAIRAMFFEHRRLSPSHFFAYAHHPELYTQEMYTRDSMYQGRCSVTNIRLLASKLGLISSQPTCVMSS